MKRKNFIAIILSLILMLSCVSCSQPAKGPTDPLPSENAEPSTDTSPQNSIMPDQSYIGVWSTQDATEEIFIYEITPSAVKFDGGFYRTLSYQDVYKRQAVCFAPAFFGQYLYIASRMQSYMQFIARQAELK